jgi:hypothetical protein
VPSPSKSQRYASIPRSSVELPASNVVGSPAVALAGASRLAFGG